ncbi:MAG TPA: carbohydrate ABC transporter permease [Chloroflexota bacterium]|nr:carbohydrate ABC transporter permease [Chloroflexota bacterium]
MAIREQAAGSEQLATPLSDPRDAVANQEAEAWRDVSVGAQVLSYTMLVVMTALLMFPFVWMVSTALRPSGYDFDTSLIPRPHIAFENFGLAWNYPDTMFPQYTINSVIIAVVGTCLSVVLNTLSGFAFSKFSFRGRDVLFLLVIATMMIPFQVIMIPVYVTLATLGLVNTYWGVILPSTASPFGIFLMRQFIQSIPNELLDAARIDGTSELGIFTWIVVPLAMPAISVFAILHFVFLWNDYLLPLLVMNRQEMYTLQLGIKGFMTEYQAKWNFLMAMTLVSLIPTVAVFLFFQKYFVRGIAMTGLKG